MVAGYYKHGGILQYALASVFGAEGVIGDCLKAPLLRVVGHYLTKLFQYP
jgi:hypothetical protein